MLRRPQLDAPSVFLSAGSQVSVADVLAIAGDTVGDLLDKQQGHTVTNKDIFRYNAQGMFARQHRPFQTDQRRGETITVAIACI